MHSKSFATNTTRLNQRKQRLTALLLYAGLATYSLLSFNSIAATNVGSSSSSQSDTTSSSQPLWSYQPKPNIFSGALNSQQQAGGGHYLSQPTSIFDSLSSLSQRQGSLSTSPFLSILPIILIAAGGMMLLLPLLTMMMASPFSGGFGQYGGGLGYPQVANLNRKRSASNSPLGANANHRMLFDFVDNISTSIEELSRKFNVNPSSDAQPKRAKSLNEPEVEKLMSTGATSASTR